MNREPVIMNGQRLNVSDNVKKKTTEQGVMIHDDEDENNGYDDDGKFTEGCGK